MFYKKPPYYFLLLLVAGAYSSSSFAAGSVNYLKQGKQEFRIQGLFDFDAEDSYSIDAEVKYGYFIVDNWELGANISTDLGKSYKSGNVGVFTEYNFTNSSYFVPYVGLATELVRATYDDRGNNLESKNFNATAVNIKSSLGVKYFISENVAVTTEVNYNVVTDHLKVSGGDAKDAYTKILIGTSFYF